MPTRLVVLPVLSVLAVAAAGCTSIGGKAERADASVSAFGDVSDVKTEAVPEKEDGYIAPSAKELSRMRAFLAANVPKAGIVRTIETPWGDTIDCVDILKQPALLKLGMEDHQLQRKPRGQAGLGSLKLQANERDSEPAIQDYARLPEPCPDASVPIRRLTIDELTRFQTLEDFLNKYPSRNRDGSKLERPEDLPEAGPTDRHQYAAARRYVDNWGAESVLNLWKPFTESTREFTLSQIWVARGSDDNLETVEAGWQKYRQKYGDWRSRLFIYFTPDNYDDDGCYNLECGAFVQTSSTVYIGGGFTDYSTYDGSQYGIKLLWYKDGETGHWWLRYGNTWVGYYPRDRFDSNGLRNRASRVTFGGEITDHRTRGHHTRTDMGSGYMPRFGWRWAAYQRSVRYVDTTNIYRRASGLFTIISDEDCYDIDLSESDGSWEVYFYFGGWGYGSQCE